MSVLVCISRVRELRSLKGFGEVGGGKTIVKRARVVVIHCKVVTTSGLTGRGERVDVVGGQKLPKADLMPVEMFGHVLDLGPDGGSGAVCLQVSQLCYDLGQRSVMNDLALPGGADINCKKMSSECQATYGGSQGMK